MLAGRLLGVLALVAAAAARGGEALEDYAIPSIDYTQLSGDAENAYNADLLAALQKDGILSLRNVPEYAALREKYLAAAAECAVSAQSGGAEFLLHRKLLDGTNRYTISLEAGRRLGEFGDETLAHCPQYLDVYQQFSAVVEAAIANVGSALDATQRFQVVIEGGEATMVARKMMEESVHLDHFHAYEATTYRELDEGEREEADLSLEMHTDNGLMIAMSAPEYFDVAESGEVRSKQTRTEDAGLLIKTAQGEVVKPVLQADELVLMLGSGINQWIQTSPPLKPVVHGMRYPRALSYADEGAENHKLLRAWFGKMVLLEEYQVMDNTGMTYGEYANKTTRYLLEASQDSEFAAVACPPHRALVASDSSCSLKTCKAKSGTSSSALTYSCQVTCNHDSTYDAAQCEKYCDCEDSTETGTTCWMLCVANLDDDVCPGTQQCNTATTEDKLAMECVGGTTAPSTTSPATTAPSTTSPSPTTSTPSTTAPASSSSSSDESASAGTVSPAQSPSSSSASLSEDLTVVGDNGGSTSEASAASSSAESTPTPTPTDAASTSVVSAAVAFGAAVLALATL